MTRVHPSVKKRYCPFRSTNARARHGATHSPLSTFLTRRSFRAAAAGSDPPARRHGPLPYDTIIGLGPTGTAVVRTQTGTLSCDANTNTHC